MYSSVCLLVKLELVSFSEPLIFWYEFYRLKIYDFISVLHLPRLERMQATLITLKVIPWQVITVSIQRLKLPKGFWQNKFSMTYSKLQLKIMNSAAFIKSISVNSITSVVDYNKHWLTLIRVNYKYWPWSLIPCVDILSLYIIFHNER